MAGAGPDRGSPASPLLGRGPPMGPRGCPPPLAATAALRRFGGDRSETPLRKAGSGQRIERPGWGGVRGHRVSPSAPRPNGLIPRPFLFPDPLCGRYLSATRTGGTRTTGLRGFGPAACLSIVGALDTGWGGEPQTPPRAAPGRCADRRRDPPPRGWLTPYALVVRRLRLPPQGLVRFCAEHRIKSHVPRFVEGPVNPFKFQPCGRSP